MGLSTVFLFLGFTASAFGRFFLTNQDWFVTIAGIVIMVFGAHFLGIYRIAFMDREMRMDAGDRGGSAFGAYVLGLAFAFGWTPCIGPILGSILSIAASEANVGAARRCSAPMRRGSASRSCWSRPSSRASPGSWPG
jgi:cytochrome c-type biogenesis protein